MVDTLLSKELKGIILDSRPLAHWHVQIGSSESLVVAAVLGHSRAAVISHAKTQALVVFLSESDGDSAFSIINLLLPLVHCCISLWDVADPVHMSPERVPEENTGLLPLEKVN